MRRGPYNIKPREQTGRTAKSMVDGFLGFVGFDPTLYAVFDIWDREIHGIIKGCKAVALQGSRLCVQVPSVVHRHELYYFKDQVLKRINEALGRRVVTDIRFELDQKEEHLRGKNEVRC